MVPVDLKAAYIKIISSLERDLLRVWNISVYKYIDEPNSKPQIEPRGDTKAQTCIVAWNCIFFQVGLSAFASHGSVFRIRKRFKSESGIRTISNIHMRRLQSKRSGIIFSSHTYLLNKPKQREITVFTETWLLETFPTRNAKIVFHLDRMNSLVAEQLKENIALLQAIHEANHKIVELEFQHDRAQRVRWTAQEDALLRYSAGAFGSDLAKIQAVMVSKTKKQIYFRILYQNRQQTKAE
ncbi:SANT/Myb_domain [Hexamita inflata]|uniref:SANT/Myb domain n=1 Tax=Hexamita inflata TaxID=28002 RepID=A0AA86NX87_9EUKA|nr:SANT/Myb domain [Hexamita inflata]